MKTTKASLLFVGNHFISDRNNQNVTLALMTRLAGRGWQILKTSNKKNKVFRLFDMLFTILSRRKVYQIAEVDIFSGLAFVWAELSVSLLNFLGKPVILTLHGGNLPIFSQNHPDRVQRLLRRAEIVVSPSDYLKTILGKIRPDIVVIPNFVEISSYPYNHRRLPTATLVWMRAFHKIYNPWLAPEVVSLLLNDFPDIKLTMVGPDKGDGSFEKTVSAINRLGVKDRIEFPGLVPKNEVPHWLNKGDIFLNTTNVDNAPVSVIEAMACGLCIVSTNVGGIPFLLEDGVDALLVPPEDPEAMANAVKRILTDPQLAASLSANARKKAEAFSWEKVLPMWEALFYEIMGETRD